MKEKLVSLVKGQGRKENIKKALNLIKDDLAPFKKAKNVLIKPNFTSAYNPTASTAAEAVEVILEFFEKFDPHFREKKIVIAESSGEAFLRGLTLDELFSRFGFNQIFARYPAIEKWDFRKKTRFFWVEIKTLSGTAKVRIPKEIFDFDYKISVAIPKTHDTVIATLGIKNFLMGIINPEDKSLMHGLTDYKFGVRRENKMFSLTKLASFLSKRVSWQLIYLFNNFAPAKLKDLATGFKADDYIKSAACLNWNLSAIGAKILPDLVVLDGYKGMEKDGPVYGRGRKLGIAIASADPIAADGLGAKVMGFDPEKIGYLRLIARQGRGKLTTNNLVGERIKDVAVSFCPHRHYPFQLKGNDFLRKNFPLRHEFHT